MPKRRLLSIGCVVFVDVVKFFSISRLGLVDMGCGAALVRRYDVLPSFNF